MRVAAATTEVSRLSRQVRLSVFLRSFLIQGSWNYRTLIGSGFCFALLPVLRTLYGDDRDKLEEAIARHSRVFNSHPYLAPLALGAVATLEAQGEAAEGVDRFKNAVRGSLGTLGDRLVWTGWRPVTLLVALAFLLLGAPWWAGVLGYLLVYNTGHLLLRGWAFKIGSHEPRRVAERLRHPAVERLQRWLTLLGAFLVGLVLPVVIASLPDIGEGPRSIADPSHLFWLVAAGIGAGLGVHLGARVRTAVVISLTGFTILSIILG
jgi:PTS system mannose-specific IID component